MSAQLGKALGKVTSGVYILTLQAADQPQGVLITWIAQASFKPPMIAVALNKERPLLKWLEPGCFFSVNVLSKQNQDIFKAFARPAQAEIDNRFAGFGMLKNAEGGGPLFAEALAYLNCRVAQIIVHGGDHHLVLAEVLSGRLLASSAEPMVHIRNNGLQY